MIAKTHKFTSRQIACIIIGIFCFISAIIIPFSIARACNSTNINNDVEIKEYLTFDGTCAWLVLNKAPKLDGEVYEVNGDNMFWSKKYQAYCYIIISRTIPKINIDIKSCDTIDIDYSGDINLDGTVNESDALIVQDMYNAICDDNITPEVLLRADMNGSGDISIEDVLVIVSIMLNP